MSVSFLDYGGDFLGTLDYIFLPYYQGYRAVIDDRSISKDIGRNIDSVYPKNVYLVLSKTK